MVIRSVSLETVCGYTSTLPDNQLPEIAFAGKSNVGKSSLINSLMNRKSLARISSRPGKTQTINFYNINHVMYLTDLPGYGYAKATITEKQKWGEMIENYLHHSVQLRAVFLLIDIRHDPSENDCQMYEWMLSQGFSPLIIATKRDKIRPAEVDRQCSRILEVLQAEPDTVILPFSAMTGEGREEIWQLMDQIIGYEEEAEVTEHRRDPEKKPRRKSTGKAPAKKTVRNRKRKTEKKTAVKRKKKG